LCLWNTNRKRAWRPWRVVRKCLQLLLEKKTVVFGYYSSNIYKWIEEVNGVTYFEL
jgi:hypothetical protein